MGNGKNVQQELRDIAKDEGVPMKTKVSLLAAGQADTYDLVNDIKKSLDGFMKDQTERLTIVETKQETNSEEIAKQRSRSDRNDIFASMGTFLVALATFFGINK